MTKEFFENLNLVEDELIRLNQAADLAEKLYVQGIPEEYVLDCMIAHTRTLNIMFQRLRQILAAQ